MVEEHFETGMKKGRGRAQCAAGPSVSEQANRGE
jgi:hypothetical protein